MPSGHDPGGELPGAGVPQAPDHLQVAWPHAQTVFPGLPARPGLTFCFPRDCHLVTPRLPISRRGDAGACAADDAAAVDDLVAISWADTAERGGGPLLSSMEPRVSPDGETLVFVSHQQVLPL